MLAYRNHRSRFTSVRTTLHTGWKEQLHSLGITYESGVNIYGLNQRLIQLVDECAVERKKLRTIEKNLSVLKQLADTDYELTHYIYVVRQITIIKMILKWQLESLAVAKQELFTIEKKLQELQIPPTRALQSLQAEALIEESICNDLKTEVGQLQHQLEQMESYYGIEKPPQESQSSLPEFNIPEMRPTYTPYADEAPRNRFQRLCLFFRRHMSCQCLCSAGRRLRSHLPENFNAIPEAID